MPTRSLISHSHRAGVYLGGPLGAFGSRLRITYTGGYWWDATENNTGVKPAPAIALPDDLKLAWVLQCSHLWQSKDRLGAGVSKEPGKFSALKEYDLIPEVSALLRDYVRFAMNDFGINISPEAYALIKRLQTQPTGAIIKTLDHQNELTVGHIQLTRLSSKGKDTLGVITNRFALLAKAAQGSI